MFDIGFGEMLVLAAIALIAIGPKQLPEVARTVGKLLNEFKRATGELTRNFTDSRNYIDEVRTQVTAPVHSEGHPDPHAEPAPAEPKEEQLAFAMSEAEASGDRKNG